MSTPVVPQRPARSQNPQAAPEVPEADLPKVPPRPTRHLERSISGDRENWARSPLNEPGFAFRAPSKERRDNGYINGQQEIGHTLERAPSVATLPLVGEEGSEYASLEQQAAAPGQTRAVASDLPLHAPKASVTAATAQTRIAGVTRMDSEKASEAGVGKPGTLDSDPDRLQARPPSSSSFNRPPSAANRRPPSSRGGVDYESDHEHGIPHLGIRVGLNPAAGDVQAPTPNPPMSAGSAGFTGSRPATADGRRKSAQGFYGPPGSYGLHGHGVGPHDSFEKAWYQKHPDEFAKDEHGAHGHANLGQRSEWAMSSDELNRLVHSSGGQSDGMGTNSEMIGTPDEQIGYSASEKYAFSKPATKADAEIAKLEPLKKVRSGSRGGSAGHAESPLKRMSFPENAFEGAGNLGNEASDDKVHVSPPTKRVDKYTTGGNPPNAIDLGADAGNSAAKGGLIHDQGVGTPILASDEIKRFPNNEWRLPAVSHHQQKHHKDEEYYSGSESDSPYKTHYRSGSRSRSRPSSRPNSVHDHHGLSRYASHEVFEGSGTPLEAVEEYEPLFKEDEKDEPKRPLTAAEKLKRPELERHRFPSQDIWEDTPSSLQYTTEVDTPEDTPVLSRTAATFESPDKEQARKGEVTEAERSSFMDASVPGVAKAKPKFNAGVQQEVAQRPGLKHRFPSQDIWEDTPDSLQYTTIISDEPDAPDAAQRPVVPARPARTREIPAANIQAERKAPTIPDRPKPAIRPRPKGSGDDKPEPSGLSRSIEADNVDAAPAVKAKPVVPPRPEGGSSKFASIKAGFMSDLNSRLKLGPQAPPKPQPVEEPEEEKAPLADARKGRARGPTRRKPAASEGDTEAVSAAPKFSISIPQSVWSVGTSGSHDVRLHEKAAAAALEQKLQSNPNAPMGAKDVLSHAPDPAGDARAKAEEDAAKARIADFETERIGHPGDVPEAVEDDSHLPAVAAEEATGAELSPVESRPSETVTSLTSHELPEKTTQALDAHLAAGPSKHTVTDHAGVQTGMIDITASVAGDPRKTEKLTVALGADAAAAARKEPGEGNVTVKD